MQPALFLLLAVVWVAPVQAQTEQVTPNFSFTTTTDGPIHVQNASVEESKMAIDWTYQFPTSGNPQTGTMLNWTLEEGEGCQVHFLSGAFTYVPFAPAKINYTGKLVVAVAAEETAPAGPALCKLDGVASASQTTTEQTASITFSSTIAYRLAIEVKVLGPNKTAGPQKQIPYAIEFTNKGNARTQINFEQNSAPSGKRWDILLPDPVILDSPYAGGGGKTTDTVTITIATPFHDGYVDAMGRFLIDIHIASADQPDLKGETQTIELNSHAQGFYIPGPSPALLLFALALAGIAARRSR